MLAPAVVGRSAVAPWSLRKAATTNDADNSEELRFHQAFAKRCSRHRVREADRYLPVSDALARSACPPL